MISNVYKKHFSKKNYCYIFDFYNWSKHWNLWNHPRKNFAIFFLFHSLINFRNSENNSYSSSFDHCNSVSSTYFFYSSCHILSNRLLRSRFFVSIIRMKIWMIWKKISKNKIEIQSLTKSEFFFDNQTSRFVCFLCFVNRNC